MTSRATGVKHVLSRCPSVRSSILKPLKQGFW